MSSSVPPNVLIDPRPHALNEFLAQWRDNPLMVQLIKERTVDLIYYGPGGPQSREQRIHKQLVLEQSRLAEIARREKEALPVYTHMAVDRGTLSGARDVLRVVLDARASKEVKGRKLITPKPNRAERRKKRN